MTIEEQVSRALEEDRKRHSPWFVAFVTVFLSAALNSVINAEKNSGRVVTIPET